MKAKLCDRCGKFFAIEDSDKGIYKVCVLSNTKSRYIHSLDLCLECQDELVKWFNSKNKGDKND